MSYFRESMVPLKYIIPTSALMFEVVWYSDIFNNRMDNIQKIADAVQKGL